MIAYAKQRRGWNLPRVQPAQAGFVAVAEGLSPAAGPPRRLMKINDYIGYVP
jgi:hypothetical protein